MQHAALDWLRILNKHQRRMEQLKERCMSMQPIADVSESENNHNFQQPRSHSVTLVADHTVRLLNTMKVLQQSLEKVPLQLTQVVETKQRRSSSLHIPTGHPLTDESNATSQRDIHSLLTRRKSRSHSTAAETSVTHNKMLASPFSSSMFQLPVANNSVRHEAKSPVVARSVTMPNLQVDEKALSKVSEWQPVYVCASATTPLDWTPIVSVLRVGRTVIWSAMTAAFASMTAAAHLNTATFPDTSSENYYPFQSTSPSVWHFNNGKHSSLLTTTFERDWHKARFFYEAHYLFRLLEQDLLWQLKKFVRRANGYDRDHENVQLRIQQWRQNLIHPMEIMSTKLISESDLIIKGGAGIHLPSRKQTV